MATWKSGHPLLVQFVLLSVLVHAIAIWVSTAGRSDRTPQQAAVRNVLQVVLLPDPPKPALDIPIVPDRAVPPPPRPVQDLRERHPRASAIPRLDSAPSAPYDQTSPVDTSSSVDTPSSTPDDNAKSLPRINLDATKQRVRELARESADADHGLPLAGASRHPSVKLADDMAKAAKPDCRNAYAGLGILAVPFLLASAIADTGCRW